MLTINQSVLIGSSIPPGANQVRLHQQLKQGDIILTLLPLKHDEAMAMAKACRQAGIYFCFSELLHRGTTDTGKGWNKRIPRKQFYTKKQLDQIIDEAGPYYYARVAIGEIGGVLYFPKAYLINRGMNVWSALPKCQTHAEAEQAYVDYCRHWIDYERKELGKGALMNVDSSSLVFKYHCMAGIDVLCLEVMPGDPLLMHAAIRGAAHAYDKPWGAHIAMQGYGGLCLDELYQKRWRTSVFYSYITGAQFIYPESGHYLYNNITRKQHFGFHSKQTKRVRSVIREAWQFARIHQRPPGGPLAAIGVLHGRHDGSPGLWNRYVWGQYHDEKWLEGTPERGWQLINQWHRREDWPKETVQGDTDFSGNPPLGQFDVVPIEARLQKLKRYTCLVCLGWNSITGEDYKKLKSFVHGGGKLLMFLPQLSRCTDRACKPDLIYDGDLTDLFGVAITGTFDSDVRGVKCMRSSAIKSWRFPMWRINSDPRFMGRFTPARVKTTTARVISGWCDHFSVEPQTLESRPILVENRVGKGMAYLVTAWEYPADEGLARFTQDILRVVAQGEQGHIRLIGSDRVRYAVYRGSLPGSRRVYDVVYLLNTDPDCDAPIRLWIKGKQSKPFLVPANELRLAYHCRGFLLIPADKPTDIKCWKNDMVTLYSATNQKIEVHNMSRRSSSIAINNSKQVVNPGESVSIAIRKHVDPHRRMFFANDFLEEPPTRYINAPLPY